MSTLEANINITQALGELLETLLNLVRAYDPDTLMHSLQVAVYANALAPRLALDWDEQTTLVRAAVVHDLGKTVNMKAIIAKPGPLTPAEYEVVKQHPDLGAMMIGQIPGARQLVPVVRHHHERWDGRGYPDGLARTQIPRAARILAVADTLDVLCSGRPYHAKLTLEQAKQEIVRCAGTQFDPDVVSALVDFMRESDPGLFRPSPAILHCVCAAAE